MTWSIDSYQQQAEQEIWDGVAANDFTPAAAQAGREAEAPQRAEVPANGFECDCNGTGIYHGRGSVVNGVFVGFTGKCFRCGGKGFQTAEDVRRNTYYDNRVRRY